MMRAIVQRATGDPNVLKLEEVAIPDVRPRDVLIQTYFCGVCYHDVVVRRGILRRGVEIPLVPGHEVAGIVVAVGAEVSDFAPGDKVCTVQRRSVCGRCRQCRSGREVACEQQEFMGDAGLNGGYAEYVAVAEDCTARVPEGVSLDHAAIAACAIGTQLNAIRDVGGVRLGETVLIAGASGGQGAHGVQIARASGAHVLAVTSSKAKSAAILANGAHAVVVAAHGTDFSAEIRRLTGSRGVDVVIDNVGTEVFHAVRRSLVPFGRWILVGAISGSTTSLNPAQLFLHGISLLSAVSCSRSQLEESLLLISHGVIKPIISKTYRLDEAVTAHSELEKNSSGKMVLGI